MLRQRLLILATLAIVTPTLAEGQTTSNWLAPIDGLWGDPTNWSTDPIAPNVPGYEAVLDAVGVPYRVTIDSGVTPDRLAINSPDAEVVLDGGSIGPGTVVGANAAPLILSRGVVNNARLAGGAGVLAQRGGALVLDNATLATSLGGNATSVDLTGNLAMEDALIVADDLGLDFNGDTQLTGQGEIRYSNRFSRDLTIEGDSPQIEIGEDVSLRSTLGTVYIRPASNQTGSELITNKGVVEADGGTFVFDSRVSTANEGVLRAVNGGRLFLNGFRNYRSVGELDFGVDGEIHFSGFYRLGQSVEVPEQGDLGLWGTWEVAAPITVDGVVGLGGNTSVAGGGNWTWGDSAAVEIRSSFVRPSTLLNLETTASTEIRFRYDGELNLQGVELDLNDILGQWNFRSAHFTNGTITGLPGGGVIDGESDNVTLETIVLNTPTTIAAGFVTTRFWAVIDQPVNVEGGTFRLRDTWTNPGGITVDGGRLELYSLPDDQTDLGTILVRSGAVSLPAIPDKPSAIVFTGGDLELRGFATTPTELQSQPWTPANVLVSSGAVLDLEGQTVDVAGAPWGLGATGGEFRNGVLWKSTDDGPWRVAQAALRDVTLQTDIDSIAGVSLRGAVTIESARLNGVVNADSADQLTLQGVTINDRFDANDGYGDAEPIVATGGLTVNGELELGVRTLRVEGGVRTIDGTGEINTYGIRGAPGGGIEAIGGGLTLGPGFTFRSARNGSFITVESGALINEGVIFADRDSYGQQTQDVTEPSITITAGIGFGRSPFHQNGALWIEEDYEVRVEANTLINAGEIELRGGLLNTGPSGVQNEGELRGDGAVVAFGSRGFRNAARLLVGDHPIYNANDALVSEEAIGLLQIIGDYNEEETATLLIDLAGSDPAIGYDRLVVSGEADLAGSLEVSLLDGYDPPAGQTFEVFTAGGGLSGEFSQVTLPTLTGGRDWLVEYLAASVRLRVLGLPGDYNADGLVTQDDLAIYREEYGAVGVGLSADGNGDGRVDAADYTVWRDALASQPTVVPERGGLAGLLLGLAACRWHRWRA